MKLRTVQAAKGGKELGAIGGKNLTAGDGKGQIAGTRRFCKTTENALGSKHLIKYFSESNPPLHSVFESRKSSYLLNQTAKKIIISVW